MKSVAVVEGGNLENQPVVSLSKLDIQIPFGNVPQNWSSS